MGSSSNRDGRQKHVAVYVYLFIYSLSLSLVLFCHAAIDAVACSQFVKDPDALVSAGNFFELGFFSPVNSTNSYVGEWHIDISTTTPVPVWVANRNKPLKDSSGTMTIYDAGNLAVLNGQRQILCSSNVSIGDNNSSAQLTDDGNLILRDKTNGKIMWESFQQPSDTLWPKMIFSNARTGDQTLVTSWISPSDPSIGNFSAGINPLGLPEVFVWNNSRPYWRSGP